MEITFTEECINIVIPNKKGTGMWGLPVPKKQ